MHHHPLAPTAPTATELRWQNVTWDAWNRVVSVKNADAAPAADPAGAYSYDALHRRTKSVTAEGERHFYYDDTWRCVEERRAGDGWGYGTTTVTPVTSVRHLWAPQSRWSYILRDRSETALTTQTNRPRFPSATTSSVTA